MAHRTRDASFEEVLHMVHDYGIKPALPEMQLDLIRITDAAMERDLWQGTAGRPRKRAQRVLRGNLRQLPRSVDRAAHRLRGAADRGRAHPGGHFALRHLRAHGVAKGCASVDPEGLAILQEFFQLRT